MANRGNFSGRIGFILAAAGSAVGLGNIWQFPYKTGMNGGAAFLVIYFLLTFPLVFSQGQSPSEGPGLVFIVLPGIFNTMGPVLGRIIGGGFFLLLCFAALTSTISLLEVPVAFFVDRLKMNRKVITWIIALVIFIIGLPSMLSMGAVEFFSSLPFYHGRSALTFVGEMFNDIGLPLGGCLMSIFIATRWRTENLSAELSLGNPSYKGSFLERYITITMKYLCPVLLGIFSVMIIIEKFFGLDKIF